MRRIDSNEYHIDGGNPKGQRFKNRDEQEMLIGGPRLPYYRTATRRFLVNKSMGHTHTQDYDNLREACETFLRVRNWKEDDWASHYEEIHRARAVRV